MSTILIIAIILVILGIAGSLTPALPGPVFSFTGLLILFFNKPGALSLRSLILFGATMLLLSLVDYIAPVLGAKFSGASKKGLAGAAIGSLIGLIFLPPLGIFIGALAGAFFGEIAGGKNPPQAIRAGLGTILGSLSVIILQTIFSLVAAIYFFVKLF